VFEHTARGKCVASVEKPLSFTKDERDRHEAMFQHEAAAGIEIVIERGERLPVRRVHAGADHLLVPLNTRQSLAALDYDLDAGRRFMLKYGFVTVAFVFREAERLFHARNAFASGGVLEDPATGAAAAAFAGMLRDLQLLADGEIVIIQGEDMGRPSRIEAAFTSEAGSSIKVSGASTPIDEG
ncbi:MAG: PhzF family phenazine biosynthesis protein, partial [Rhizobiaceae bacterium]|nr:PhzF family phenazine biosynthesis protein [Rhizobiaceae bacterium]